MPEQVNAAAPEHQNDEYHVASFVAHAIADSIEEVSSEILNLPGAEIHATSEVGKIVFTIESTSQKSIGRYIDHVRHHKGLLSLSPVYHQFLNEEQQVENEKQTNQAHNNQAQNEQ